jgi:lysyl endopeptidase
MVGDQRLESPPIKLPPADGLTMQFWHLRDIEPYDQNCYDGGLLEISLDGGPWNAVSAARLLRDPYNGGIVESYKNPLGGMAAWCGKIDWSHVVVDLSDYGGQTAQFRFRLGTDMSNGRPGWTVDDVSVQACGWTELKLFLSAIQR